MCFFRVSSFGMLQIRHVSVLGSGVSLTEEFILGKELSVSSMADDLSDPGLLMLIRILQKKRIFSRRRNFLCQCQHMEEIIFNSTSRISNNINRTESLLDNWSRLIYLFRASVHTLMKFNNLLRDLGLLQLT